MSIFQHPLLLVCFSFLLCPVASQTGHYGPKEVKSGHCTSAELVKTAADCQAAAKALGLKGTMWGMTSDRSPPGCIWANIYGSGYPRNFIPSFSWGGAAGFTTYQLNKVIEVAKVVMKRRDMQFSKIDENILQHVFDNTAKNRAK